MLRNIRLTADQAGQLANTLSELAGGLEDAGDGAARYGLLIGLYQPRQPDPGTRASPIRPPIPALGMNAPFPGSRRGEVVAEESRDNGSR